MDSEEHQLLHGLPGVYFQDCHGQANQVGRSAKFVVRSGFTRMGFLSSWSKYTAAEFFVRSKCGNIFNK